MKGIFVFIFSIFFFGLVNAQVSVTIEIPDSLKNNSFEQLSKKFIKAKKDSLKADFYAKMYLVKAKSENSPIQIAEGYLKLGSLYKSDYLKSIAYFDSGINASKHIKHEKFPAILYTYKGSIYFLKGKYKASLDNYLQAIKYAESSNNIELLYVNKYNIGLLKKRLEKYNEALIIYKECYAYEEKNPKRDTLDFIRSHLALTNIYIETQQFDSVLKYNQRGLKIVMKHHNKSMQPFFILNQAVLSFHKQEYQKTIDSIQHVLPSILTNPNKSPLIKAYFYLGKAYDSIKEKEKAIFNYQKIDSIFSSKNSYISSTIISSYDALYNHYKVQKDKQKQLYYLEKRILVDQLLHNEYKYLSSTISKKFDRRLLLSEQKSLNDELQHKNQRFNILIIGFTIVLMILIVWFSIKQKKLKGRFEKAIKIHEQKKNAQQTIHYKDIKSIGIPEDIVAHLLKQLKQLETEDFFLNKDITLTNLSKKLHTNPVYLSKIINTYKNKSFVEYQNDLRISYAMDKIQTDRKFPLFTVKAIANEVGFNNSQSFARAFKRKTAMKPSDFIYQVKNLKK